MAVMAQLTFRVTHHASRVKHHPQETDLLHEYVGHNGEAYCASKLVALNGARAQERSCGGLGSISRYALRLTPYGSLDSLIINQVPERQAAPESLIDRSRFY